MNARTIGCAHAAPVSASSHTVLGIATAIAVAAIKAKGHPEERDQLTTMLADIGKDVLASFVKQDEFFEALGAEVNDARAAGELVQAPDFPKLTGNAKQDSRAIASWLSVQSGGEPLDSNEPADRALNSLFEILCGPGAGCSR